MRQPRRLLQYRLGTLIIIATVLAAACGLLSLRANQARRQHRAAVVLQRLGCEVLYDYESGAQVPLAGSVPRPDKTVLRSLLGDDFFDRVVSVRAPYRKYNQEKVLQLLSDLPHLEKFNAGSASLANADLSALKDKRHLKVLGLSETVLDDGSLEPLENLQLEWLSFHRTRVSDEGLKSLRHMTSLKHLDLTRTKVSDKGLVHLKKLKNLKTLSLRRSLVTLAGYRQIQRELPQCRVSWEPLLHVYFDEIEKAVKDLPDRFHGLRLRKERFITLEGDLPTRADKELLRSRLARFLGQRGASQLTSGVQIR